ncbi:MAG: four helix bundle protein [Deltaproteobacteria bacterium]|nr:four helix bundle protein [Deltaproteobacteria bacterium]
MNQIQSTKQFDLEDRTFLFAKNIALYVRQLPRNISNLEYVKQVVRSAGSVGANYIEANEALSKKDFAMRIKICRKEAKESAYWLKLIVETNDEKHGQEEGMKLLNEATQLKKIFSSILVKSV